MYVNSWNILCLKLNAPGPSIVPAAKLSPIAGMQVCTCIKQKNESISLSLSLSYCLSIDIHFYLGKIFKDMYILNRSIDFLFSTVI